MQSQKILAQRGILPAARLARWQATYNGWRIPLYRPDGSRYPKAAWKAYDSHAVPKYRIPYKKHECAIYMLPGILAAIAASGGKLIIAGGFVDNLTCHAAGIPHVVSFLGESAIPDDLLTTLQGWNVTSIHLYPHLDETGKNASQKIKSALQGAIPCTAYHLPAALGEGGDLNDLWTFAGFNSPFFSGMLAHLPILELPDLPPPDPIDPPDDPGKPPPAPPGSPDSPSPQYGLTALEREADQLASSKTGRNNALNKAAFRVGQIIGAGVLDQPTATYTLQQAALSTGLTLKEILPTLQSGMNAGIRQPRQIRTKQPGSSARTAAPDRALPDNAREKLLHEKFITSRGKVSGVTVARMLEILLRVWEPGRIFTAKEAVTLLAPYHIGRSDVYAILGLSPEKPLFFFGQIQQSSKPGDAPRQYRLPTAEAVCCWLGIEGDLLIFPLPPEALRSAQAYRLGMHTAYLSRLGETTLPTRAFAERLNVQRSTISNYEKAIRAHLTKEARFERVVLRDVRQLPDAAAAYQQGIFLENGAGVRGRVTAQNFYRGLAQTGCVFLCRRLSSRRVYEAEVLRC